MLIMEGECIIRDMDIRKIRGVVKDYAWGNSDFIPSLIGGYTGRPQAELWLGTHPSGDASVEGDGTLSALVMNDKAYLGEKGWNEYGGKLPLLMKVLAIAKPLSLQCHPDKVQAERGWKREEDARKRGEAVSYQDDNEKCEMIAALSPITAMCGFRDLEVIKADLAAAVPAAYGRTLKSLAVDIEMLFMSLFSLPDEEKEAILSELRASLEASAEPSWEGLFITRKGISLECLDEYPGAKAMYLLADLAYGEQDYQAAADYYAQIAAAQGATYLASLCNMNEAACYENLGDQEAALQLYRHVVDTYGDSGVFAPKAMFSIGRIYDAQGNADLAQAEFETLTGLYLVPENGGTPSEYARMAEAYLINYAD